MQGFNKDGTTNVVTQGKNKVIGTFTVTFPASATIGTVETVSVPLPEFINKDAKYLVCVSNPSGLASGVTLKFNNQLLFGGSTPIFCAVASQDVTSNTNQCFIVTGWLLGEGNAQIIVTNDAAVSASGGTVDIEVIEM